jgi:hypothetical protein
MLGRRITKACHQQDRSLKTENCNLLKKLYSEEVIQPPD